MHGRSNRSAAAITEGYVRYDACHTTVFTIWKCLMAEEMPGNGQKDQIRIVGEQIQRADSGLAVLC